MSTDTDALWARFEQCMLWIPVAVLPAPCLKVIATYANRLGNRRTIMAKWVPGKTEEAHSLDDEFGEYDEATDTTYAPEGWYEVIDNFDDCTFVAVSEGVITHWMPLPEAPGAIRAGHAAAKAKTAAAVAGRWYFVTNDGAATLCVDEADARESAAEADIAFPRMAPHLVTQLVSASQLAAAVAAERERCLRIVESVDNYSNPMTANDCAGAIRAGATERGE